MTLELTGCLFQPLAAYLKALAVLRLATQADENARGFWNSRHFVLESNFDHDGLLQFFLTRYRPTPVLAPWNGGSGFYPKDRKIGINAIRAATDERFAQYQRDLNRAAAIVSEIGDQTDEDQRRTAILRRCRNELSDNCVEWLDASIAIAADESRAFAPILGTGGNEGRLDYTNNFLENLTRLLVAPDKKTPVRALLEHALFGTFTAGLQSIPVGQYDPGRAGGFNQGNGIAGDAVANPWNTVLTVEGAIAWAGGIYRKQGISYRSFLCSPFTVKASAAGYGSATEKDGTTARAEIWTPIWENAARYEEIRALLREGRAAVSGKPAQNGLEFAEAAASLGVDRSISSFVRYSLVKRRGDSYIALPNGKFPVQYRSTADRVREITLLLDRMQSLAKGPQSEVPNSWPPLVRAVEEAIFQALLHGSEHLLIQVAGAFGAMCRWLLSHGRKLGWHVKLSKGWIEQCTKMSTEARIAAALAGLRDANAKGLLENLTPGHAGFSWIGRDLPARLLATLRRRTLDGQQSDRGPFWSGMPASVGDVIAFLDQRTDDELIENLTFAFVFAEPARLVRTYNHGETGFRRWPAYCILKQLFASEVHRGVPTGNAELRPTLSITALMAANRVQDAVEAAIRRLRISGLHPLLRSGWDSENGMRLGAALVIPVRDKDLSSLRRFITEPEEELAEV